MGEKIEENVRVEVDSDAIGAGKKEIMEEIGRLLRESGIEATVTKE